MKWFAILVFWLLSGATAAIYETLLAGELTVRDLGWCFVSVLFGPIGLVGCIFYHHADKVLWHRKS